MCTHSNWASISHTTVGGWVLLVTGIYTAFKFPYFPPPLSWWSFLCLPPSTKKLKPKIRLFCRSQMASFSLSFFQCVSDSAYSFRPRKGGGGRKRRRRRRRKEISSSHYAKMGSEIGGRRRRNLATKMNLLKGSQFSIKKVFFGLKCNILLSFSA